MVYYFECIYLCLPNLWVAELAEVCVVDSLEEDVLEHVFGCVDIL